MGAGAVDAVAASLQEFGWKQPVVIMRSNALVRLINLYPKTTVGELALRGWIKTHIGGNKTWWKNI